MIVIAVDQAVEIYAEVPSAGGRLLEGDKRAAAESMTRALFGG